MHFTVRDAAVERAELAAARALRCGEQRLAGVTVAQQGTPCRVGAWKTPRTTTNRSQHKV